MSEPVLGALATLFGMSDEQAMWRVQMHDDSHAFSRLLQRWHSPIQRLCARMTGDPHKAEDLAQETFARVYAKRKEYQPSGRFSTFLWRVALNLCYDELRRIKRRGEAALPEEIQLDTDVGPEFRSGELAPDAALARDERAEMVSQAVLALPDAYRSVIVLRHYENLKFREIAEILGIPEGTVKSRMAEALSQLSTALSRDLREKPTRLPRRESPRERLMI